MKSRHFINAIGLVLLVVILASVDFGKLLHQLRRSNYFYLIPVVLLIAPQIALRALRWQRLMASQGIQCPLGKAFIFYFAAIFLGLITPGRMGELAKCYFLKVNHIAGISQALPSVLVDRALDLYFLGLLSLVLLFHTEILPIASWTLLLSGLALMVLPWIIYYGPRVGEKAVPGLAGRLLRCVPNHWQGSWTAFTVGLKALLSQRLVEAVGWTGLSYLIFFSQTFLIGRATGLPLNGLTIAAVVAIAILVGYIPITVAGLGTREATLIFLFGRVGISATSALSFAILYNLVYIVCVGLTSSIFWMILPNRSKLQSAQTQETR